MNKQDEKIAVVSISAVLTIVLSVLISLILDFNLIRNLTLGWIMTAFYAVFVILLYGTDIRREIIEKPVYIDKIVEKVVEKPVEVIKEIVKEVPIQIPVENKTIEVVEKPVYRDVFRDRVKVVQSPVRRLNIPKYKFVASKETKRYHTRNCRLGKLIKKKFKINSNSQNFFKKKKFKACKICLRR